MVGYFTVSMVAPVPNSGLLGVEVANDSLESRMLCSHRARRYAQPRVPNRTRSLPVISGGAAITQVCALASAVQSRPALTARLPY